MLLWGLCFVGILACIACLVIAEIQDDKSIVDNSNSIVDLQAGECLSCLGKIVVTSDIHDLVDKDGRTKIVIWASNNTSEYFTGNVSVYSLDENKQLLGWEIIPFYDLGPGERSWGICWLKITAEPNVETRVTGDFSPD